MIFFSPNHMITDNNYLFETFSYYYTTSATAATTATSALNEEQQFFNLAGDDVYFL